MSQKGGVPTTLALLRQSRALKTLRETLLGPLNSLQLSTNRWEADSTPGSRNPMKLELLATIALQLTIEMLTAGDGVMCHLQYAVNLIRDLGWFNQKADSSIGRLLLCRIAFIDITGSLMWSQRPLLPPSFWIFRPENSSDDSTPSLREMTGCPHRCFAFLAEIAHLAADHDNSPNDQEILAKAYDVESTFREYGSTHFQMKAGRAEGAASHLETLSRCYYWTTLILLQRRLCRDARASPRIQFAVNVLIDLMECLPVGCGPDSSLALPLSTAAHEAIDPEQRRRIVVMGDLLAKQYPSKTREVMNRSFERIWAEHDESLRQEDVRRQSAHLYDADIIRSRRLILI